MSLARSRLRIRRTSFTHAHTSLNLIPLVDILTAIVFFSLLSAVTLRSALASFDVVQAPVVAAADGVSDTPQLSRPEVVVRVDRARFIVRHAMGETVIRRSGKPDGALPALHGTLVELIRALGGRASVTVVPSDDVVYDDLVRVLDEVHRVEPRAISLGARARK
jgi:biopolymer transport protein ExbD